MAAEARTKHRKLSCNQAGAGHCAVPLNMLTVDLDCRITDLQDVRQVSSSLKAMSLSKTAKLAIPTHVPNEDQMPLPSTRACPIGQPERQNEVTSSDISKARPFPKEEMRERHIKIGPDSCESHCSWYFRILSLCLLRNGCPAPSANVWSLMTRTRNQAMKQITRASVPFRSSKTHDELARTGQIK